MIITKREPEPPLPTPFELPRNYPPLVMSELSNNKLSGKGKAKLISSIAAAIYRFKSFPTSDEYNHVGQQVVLKYNFLKSNEGSGYVRFHNIICLLVHALNSLSLYRVISFKHFVTKWNTLDSSENRKKMLRMVPALVWKRRK